MLSATQDPSCDGTPSRSCPGHGQGRTLATAELQEADLASQFGTALVWPPALLKLSELHLLQNENEWREQSQEIGRDESPRALKLDSKTPLRLIVTKSGALLRHRRTKTFRLVHLLNSSAILRSIPCAFN